MLDTEKLLAFLEQRTDHTNVVIQAVYAGLADRIRNGQFDDKENN